MSVGSLAFVVCTASAACINATGAVEARLIPLVNGEAISKNCLNAPKAIWTPSCAPPRNAL